MRGFTDLSNELHLEILQYLPPPDLGSFFCVNRHLYALTAIHRISYQSLKRRFSTSLNTHQPGSTAKLIKSILADPQIALYVQHYTIDGWREGWDPEKEVHGNNMPEHVEYSASDMRQLELALRDSQYVYIDEIEDWIERLKVGDEHVLIAHALTLFPNLTSIDFQTPDDLTSWCVKRAIHRIADAERPGGPLAKLISVTIGASECSDFIDPDDIEVITMLPSVRIVNAERVGDAYGSFEDIVPRIGSNVTDLNISDGDLAPQRLMLLLQSFESLQSFTYWPTFLSRRNCDFDAFSIVVILLLCVQDSLRELQIRVGSAIENYMGSLRKFRVLEYLETDTKLLFGHSLSLVQNFQASLPPSIREVKLHGKHLNNRALREHLTSLVMCRGLLPNLSNIELVGTETSSNEAAMLQDMCARVNISLTFVDRGPVSLPTFTRHRGHYAKRQAKKALTQREVL